jgi:hypothetical protein
MPGRRHLSSSSRAGATRTSSCGFRLSPGPDGVRRSKVAIRALYERGRRAARRRVAEDADVEWTHGQGRLHRAGCSGAKVVWRGDRVRTKAREPRHGPRCGPPPPARLFAPLFRQKLEVLFVNQGASLEFEVISRHTRARVCALGAAEAAGAALKKSPLCDDFPRPTLTPVRAIPLPFPSSTPPISCSFTRQTRWCVKRP